MNNIRKYEPCKICFPWRCIIWCTGLSFRQSDLEYRLAFDQFPQTNKSNNKFATKQWMQRRSCIHLCIYIYIYPNHHILICMFDADTHLCMVFICDIANAEGYPRFRKNEKYLYVITGSVNNRAIYKLILHAWWPHRGQRILYIPTREHIEETKITHNPEHTEIRAAM